MRRLIPLITAALVTACAAPPTSTPVTEEPTATAATVTPTTEPTPTASPTSGPLPFVTVEPPPKPQGPRVITAENVTRLQMIEQRGYGPLGLPVWSPNGERVAFTSSFGLLLYDEPAAPPRLLPKDDGCEVSSLPVWSPDGRLIAVGYGTGLYHDVEDCPARAEVWDIFTAERITLNASANANDVTFSPSGRWLAFSDHRGAPVYEVGTWEQVARYTSDPDPDLNIPDFDRGRVSEIAFSPDEMLFAFDYFDTYIYNRVTGELVTRIPDLRLPGLRFNAAGDALLTMRTTADGVFTDTYDVDTGALLDSERIAEHPAFWPRATNPAGTVNLILGESIAYMQLVDSDTGEEVARLHRGSFMSPAVFSPDGRFLYLGGSVVYGIGLPPKPIQPGTLPDPAAHPVITRENASRITVLGYDSPQTYGAETAFGWRGGTLYFSAFPGLWWSHIVEQVDGDFPVPLYWMEMPGMVHDIAFPPDPNTREATVVMSTGRGGARIVVIDLETGEEQTVIRDGGTITPGVTYTPDGSMLVTVGKEGVVTFYDAGTYEPIGGFGGIGEQVPNSASAAVDVFVSPEGYIAYAPEGSAVRVRSLLTDELVYSDDRQVRIAMDRSGKRVVVMNRAALQVLGVSSGTEITSYAFELDHPLGCNPTISEDVIAVCAPQGGVAQGDPRPIYNVLLIHARTGEEIDSIPLHRSPVTDLTFSPDGTYLIARTVDGVIYVWGLP